MAWSISMSGEGWSNVYENCIHLAESTPSRLAEGIASDETNSSKKDGSFSEYKYKTCYNKMLKIAKISPDTLADIAYNLIESNNTCTSGGHEVYLDNEGYVTIPVDLIDGED